jgi:hypothetical protein
MLSSKKMIELLALDPSDKTGNAQLRAALRLAKRGHVQSVTVSNTGGSGVGVVTTETSRPSSEQARLIEALIATPQRVVRRHVLPWADATPTIRKGPLSGSDIAWLQRLPTDHTAISDDDAIELWRLSQQIEAKGGDARLLNSIWLPVKQRHEKLAAEATIATLSASVPPLPNGTVAVLAQALEVEGGLSPQEAQVRARTRLDQMQEAGAKSRARRLEAAHRALTNVTELTAAASSAA